MKRLHTKWFEGLSDEEKVSTEQMVRAARPTLELLAKIIRKDLANLEKKTDYDSPAWQYKLAHDNGAKEKLNDVLNLLTPIIGD